MPRAHQVMPQRRRRTTASGCPPTPAAAPASRRRGSSRQSSAPPRPGRCSGQRNCGASASDVDARLTSGRCAACGSTLSSAGAPACAPGDTVTLRRFSDGVQRAEQRAARVAQVVPRPRQRRPRLLHGVVVADDAALDALDAQLAERGGPVLARRRTRASRSWDRRCRRPAGRPAACRRRSARWPTPWFRTGSPSPRPRRPTPRSRAWRWRPARAAFAGSARTAAGGGSSEYATTPQSPRFTPGMAVESREDRWRADGAGGCGRGGVAAVTWRACARRGQRQRSPRRVHRSAAPGEPQRHRRVTSARRAPSGPRPGPPCRAWPRPARPAARRTRRRPARPMVTVSRLRVELGLDRQRRRLQRRRRRGLERRRAQARDLGQQVLDLHRVDRGALGVLPTSTSLPSLSFDFDFSNVCVAVPRVNSTRVAVNERKSNTSLRRNSPTSLITSSRKRGRHGEDHRPRRVLGEHHRVVGLAQRQRGA